MHDVHMYTLPFHPFHRDNRFRIATGNYTRSHMRFLFTIDVVWIYIQNSNEVIFCIIPFHFQLMAQIEYVQNLFASVKSITYSSFQLKSRVKHSHLIQKQFFIINKIDYTMKSFHSN